MSSASPTSVGWLRLAATPTFALMALVSAAHAHGPMEMMCSGGSPLGGMVPMYLLMSAFHAQPWLSLASNARRRGRPLTAP